MHIINKLKSSSPVRLIIYTFIILIFIGTILLMLPISTKKGVNTSFTDALFTSISATSVSGLVLFDTWSHWSEFGQAIILILIQVGALGLVTVMTGFTLFLRHKLGLRDMNLAQVYTSGNIMDVSKLIISIIKITFCCELLGAFVLMIRFIPKLGLYGIWVSIFLSVSSYCNAGFDIMGFEEPNISVQNYIYDPLVSITMSLLILAGGLGFIVINDLIKCIPNIKNIFKRNRKNKKMNHLSLHSTIALKATLFIVGIGTISIVLLEYNNSLFNMSLLQKLNVAFFESNSIRSAGFCNIDPYSQLDVTKSLLILLMFIGSSPCSTGGGIKTTTFVILICTVLSCLKGNPKTVVHKHIIEKTNVYRALTITILACAVISTTFILIFIIEKDLNTSPLNILFETVSAFSTGISIGVTSQLSLISKILFSIIMFMGRVGPFSLILALSLRHTKFSSILPEANIIVG